MNPGFDSSRRNPQEDFESIQRIGSGTYGDVYKGDPFHRHCRRVLEYTLLKREIPHNCAQSLSAIEHLYKGYSGTVRQIHEAMIGPREDREVL